MFSKTPIKVLTPQTMRIMSQGMCLIVSLPSETFNSVRPQANNRDKKPTSLFKNIAPRIKAMIAAMVYF